MLINCDNINLDTLYACIHSYKKSKFTLNHKTASRLIWFNYFMFILYIFIVFFTKLFVRITYIFCLMNILENYMRIELYYSWIKWEELKSNVNQFSKKSTIRISIKFGINNWKNALMFKFIVDFLKEYFASFNRSKTG